MANTLTNLIPTMYEALDQVSRENVGFIPAVSRNSGVERAALNQSVRVPIAPAVSLADNTPAVSAPNTGDNTISSVEITISKSKHAAIRWSGEETLALSNAGNYQGINRGRFAQAFRALVNQVETDLGSLYTKASRAVGTAGTAPFGTAGVLSDAAGVRRILDENGAPVTDLQLVLAHNAMGNLRGIQSVLFKVNEAGTDSLLREGILGRLQGFDIRNSGQVAVHTIGTADADYDVDLVAGYAVGDTTIHLDTGTGTHVAGDVITFAGDSNNYVIRTGSADSGDKDIVIGAPGLRLALADGVSSDIADDTATWTANMAFSRSAIVLATRLPARPEGGDMADDVMTLTDPVSGLSFEVSMYRQYRQVHIEVALAWGYECIKPEHVALLIG
jgi:hypothetical protein